MLTRINCSSISILKMDILILISSLDIGGAEKQAVTDANMLIESGHSVTIAYGKIGDLEKILNKDITCVYLETKNVLFATCKLCKYLSDKDIDVIHAHMFWAEKIAAIVSLFKKVKIVFNEHGLGLWRKWYHKIIMQVIASRADTIINSCKLNRLQRIRVEKLPEKKNKVLYNSYDLPNNIEGDGIDKENQNKRFVIGFVGRFHPVKRLHILVDICEQFIEKSMNIKFMLIGDGAVMPSLKKEIEVKGFEDYFIFTGFQLNPQKYLTQFDVFVLPSKIEGFSVVLLEAGAAGVPCLAFNVGGNSEIIKNNLTGYIIENDNISEMADKIQFLYDNPEILKEFSNNSARFIGENFSGKKRIQGLENIYLNS